jgi:hypothetical protein
MPRPDPRVQAAEDFKDTALDLIGKDQAKTATLNSLRLGMSDHEVLSTAGPPTTRRSRNSGERTIEEWTYGGELKSLGTLTFEDHSLVEMNVNP